MKKQAIMRISGQPRRIWKSDFLSNEGKQTEIPNGNYTTLPNKSLRSFKLCSRNILAQLICTFKEFGDFVGPRVRNDVASLTKGYKDKLGYKCQQCGEKKELDAAHRHESSRKIIIKGVLEKYYL